MTPCYECDDRNLECHGRCEKYLAWKTANEKRREEMIQEAKANDDAREYVLAQQRKNKRRKR